MLSKAQVISLDTAEEAMGNAGSQNVFLVDLNSIVTGTFGQMDHDFAAYLRSFALLRPCYLITSVSYNELMTRVPSSVRRAFRGIFVSSGAELWCGDEIVERHEHCFSDDLYEYLVKVVQNSGYPVKIAPVIENGPATLRVCLAGTQATIGQLNAYLEWETEHNELPLIVSELKSKFPDHRVCQDSDASLLISPETLTTALVYRHIAAENEGARLIGYLSERAANSFARPLCETLSSLDQMTAVGGPSDLSQLMRYEIRRETARKLSAAE
ncbi:hypothetical protein [uncultured Roseibium sp.]|uniref:hypothetical protein n=1 Tax=uncultured Roseibium sp. TaxID=1936171 RepID=UPI002631F006|nr:hypothetical protein [uncultured Roseibium sp.]